MKNRIYYLLFFLLTSNITVWAQAPSAANIFAKADSVLATITSVSLETDVMRKWFHQADTQIHIVSCKLLKTLGDEHKIRYAYEELGPKESYFYLRKKQIYNGDSIVSISINDSLSRIATTKKGIKARKSFSYIPKEYLIPSFYTTILNKKKVTNVSVKTTVYNAIPCYEVKLKSSDKEYEYQNTYYIAQNSYLPVGGIEVVTFGIDVQYEAYAISNVVLNPTFDEQTFGIMSNIAPNSIVLYYDKRQKYKPNKKLKNGTVAPPLKGKTLDGKDFDLDNYKGKVVVLDFWYIGCYFCVKALPGLEELYQEYDSSEVVIIGINPYDKVDNISAFLNKRNISFPTISVDIDIEKAYGIAGYPELYVIDKNGKIASFKQGYIDTWYSSHTKTIKRKIRKALRQ